MPHARLLIAAFVLLPLCLVAATAARAATQNDWYWQPSFCKSELKSGGVQLGAGTSAPAFKVAVAYCVGLHNRCWLHGGVRLYKVFKVLALSDDGIIRSFQMNATGKTSWSGSVARLVARGVTPSGFARVYGAQEHAAAARENTLGCTDPTS
ncbi:MAG TPA: hypothetical protein VGL84_02960 [Gaiellaceae bacterium]